MESPGTKSTPSFEPFRDSPQPIESQEAIEAVLSLKRAIERVQGFCLLIAVCNQPIDRQRYISELRDRLGSERLRVVELNDETTDVLSAIQGVAGPAAALFVVGLEKTATTIEARSEAIQRLNYDRPVWGETIGKPVVLWVPEYLLGVLERDAPDFLDWRSDTIFFPTRSMDRPHDRRRIEPEVEARWTMHAEARAQRIRELRDRIAELESRAEPFGEGDHRSLVEWYSELADHLTFIGDLDEALSIRREKELPVCTKLGDIREIALTQGGIADILFQRGQLDEALRIRHEEQLPIYTKLDDIRAIAIAHGKIADIAFQRGKLDEALRIRHEEQLPVYTKLGDIRSIAITKGKIADILVQRGLLDEALRIRREEELPVYTKLGDIRSAAVTQGKIADILFQRGQLDEALRIRREEELPVCQKLGDVGGIAHCHWSMGRIALAKKDVRGALDEFAAAYALIVRLGRADGTAAVGLDLGRLLCAAGHREEGLEILGRSVALYREMKMEGEAELAQDAFDHWQNQPAPQGGGEEA